MEVRRAKTVRLINTPDRPLSEREIVEATIAFLNGARLDIEGLVSTSVTGSTGEAELEANLKLARLLKKDRNSADLPQTVEDARARLRANTKAFLEQAIENPEAVASRLIKRGTRDIVRLRTVLRRVPGGVSLASLYEFSTEFDLVFLGQILLVDKERRFLEKLCQCKLEECGDFFFEVKPPTGRPQRRYCSREHMLRAHDENASARMARRRPAKPK